MSLQEEELVSARTEQEAIPRRYLMKSWHKPASSPVLTVMILPARV